MCCSLAVTSGFVLVLVGVIEVDEEDPIVALLVLALLLLLLPIAAAGFFTVAMVAASDDDEDDEEDEVPLRAALFTAAFSFCNVACIWAAVVYWAAVIDFTGTGCGAGVGGVGAFLWSY